MERTFAIIKPDAVVLAGSAAYALGEARRWPVGLD